MRRAVLSIVIGLLILPLAVATWSPVLAATGKAQTTCPVMGGAINKDIYVDHQGKRVYFCCTACIPEFKQNPGKYLQKLEAEGVQLPPAGGKK